MYAKHGNFVDADAWRQSQHKTPRTTFRLEVIRGHAFWDHGKADEGVEGLLITV